MEEMLSVTSSSALSEPMSVLTHPGHMLTTRIPFSFTVRATTLMAMFRAACRKKYEIKPAMERVISDRRITVLTATTLDLCRFAFFEKISSFNKIVKITEYVILFCKNVKRNPIDKKKGRLETDEIKTSEKVILKGIQRKAFSGGEKLNLRTAKTVMIFYESKLELLREKI
ncbi:hypothetical protein TNCV_4413771 [Trichonephila clavipes]|uniref:Uncharacterized protein n=1 Tax=Trichonephila clavipes TaxID=2585209 RepID=A0A8X6RZY3_TRICX|nr:hypothetical protein TNCV_4413771 [Trichonephila clavipes]